MSAIQYPRRGETDFDSMVADRVRAAREACGMTRSDLARRIGISTTQLYKYEQGRNRITAGMLLRISHALGVPIIVMLATDTKRPTESAILTENFSRIERGADRQAVIRMVKALASSGKEKEEIDHG